jgi:hypothetical protein
MHISFRPALTSRLLGCYSRRGETHWLPQESPSKLPNQECRDSNSSPLPFPTFKVAPPRNACYLQLLLNLRLTAGFHVLTRLLRQDTIHSEDDTIDPENAINALFN